LTGGGRGGGGDRHAILILPSLPWPTVLKSHVILLVFKMGHRTFLYLLIFFSPVCVGETLQEIDSMLVVRHHISFYRIKEHVMLWASDPALSNLGRGTVMSLMSHLAVEVEMLCSTLLEHTQLESDYRSSMLPGTPAPSPSTSSGSSLRNELDRQRRNIFGDILSGITGMPTSEQYRHHMHVQEDLRKKMISVLKHQIESESHLTQSFTDLQTKEEQLRVHLSNLESLMHQHSSATARLFIYYHLLSEDRDMLEDTLDAMRNGAAGVRQDAYLSRLAGLHTVAKCAFVTRDCFVELVWLNRVCAMDFGNPTGKSSRSIFLSGAYPESLTISQVNAK